MIAIAQEPRSGWSSAYLDGIRALSGRAGRRNHIIENSARQTLIRVTRGRNRGDQRVGPTARSRALHVIAACTRACIPVERDLATAGLGDEARGGRNLRGCCLGRLHGAGHPFLEAANTLAQSL